MSVKRKVANLLALALLDTVVQRPEGRRRVLAGDHHRSRALDPAKARRIVEYTAETTGEALPHPCAPRRPVDQLRIRHAELGRRTCIRTIPCELRARIADIAGGDLRRRGDRRPARRWRNLMPYLEGMGRLVACDLIGMGGSDKLDIFGPDRYQREFLFALWDALDLGDRVILVLHDWGSALGFEWANRHRDRVAGIAFIEAIAICPSRSPTLQPCRRSASKGLLEYSFGA
jgi:pimeloyl-ACP methyl ester carboxylesterase